MNGDVHAYKGFSQPVQEWFSNTFDAPTAIQIDAWKVIEGGRNALVIAPTGSGKTLAAFLFAIDKLFRDKANCREAGEKWKPGVRILYVSPLKALGADVERNLQKPLAGIVDTLAASDGYAPNISVGMRTGDTDQAERAKMLRRPPDILITTPESLYLMLTSQASRILRTVETVIVDEVHSMAGSKRGSHLSLSLERLDELLANPAQRIGLSATIRPVEVAADFLGGVHPVRIVSTDAPPALDLSVRVPVPDMTSIPAFDAKAGYSGRDGKGTPRKDVWKTDRGLKAAMAYGDASAVSPDTRMGSPSIWPYLEATILDEICSHTSTIVFVNSRGLCERLTTHLNELYAKREGIDFLPEGASVAPASIRSSMGASTELVQDAPVCIAKAHHGSVSKDRRRAIEQDLKSGRLPCVVATSSLELGIDMGEVDLVLQVAAPYSVSSGLQRIGRANHNVGGRSVGIIYPKVRNELIDAAVVSEGMIAGAIEETSLVENALDVLSQQTAAAVAMAPDGLDADAWLETVRRSACYRSLTNTAYDSVLWMLAGRYASGDATDFAPRLLFDPQTRVLKPLPRTQRLAIMSAGTIPDRGLYPVMTSEPDGQGRRKRIGELDEEMVHESRVGDVIMLGTSAWRISEISKDRVLVQPAPGRSARLPFWHGEGIGRSMEDGKRRGEFLRAAEKYMQATENAGEISEDVADNALKPATRGDSSWKDRLSAAGLDENSQNNLTALLKAQMRSTGRIPNDKTVVVEQSTRDTGEWQMIIHSPFGRRVHEPWALAISTRIRNRFGYDPQAGASDDGILLNIPATEDGFPDVSVLMFDPDDAVEMITAAIGSTSLFAGRFRECAARALLMSPIAPGKRIPLWQQRQRGAQLLEEARACGDFPILAEAARECLNDVYDLEGFRELMEMLECGDIKVRSVRTETPSPFAAPLLFGYVAEHLYEGDLPTAERRQNLLSVDSSLLGELIGTVDILSLLDAEVVSAVEAELQRTAPDRRLSGIEGAAELLRVLGPLSLSEIAFRLKPDDADSQTEYSGDAHADASALSEKDARKLLDELEGEHRVFQTELGGNAVWASAEDGVRLCKVSRAQVPDWALVHDMSADEANASSMLPKLVARFARSHALFSAASVADSLGIGESVAEGSLEALEREGKVRRMGKSPDGAPDLWVDVEILKRLRLRSLARARAAVEPIGEDVYVRYVFACQGIVAQNDMPAKGIDALAETISLFEGVSLPAKLWEDAVFPARVSDYAPAMLDELLKSGDVVWVGGKDDKNSSCNVAFFPTDSPAAPELVSFSMDYFEECVEEPGAVSNDDMSRSGYSRNIIRTLSADGPLTFPQISDCLRRQFESETFKPSRAAEELLNLVWDGRVIVDSFSLVRDLNVDLNRLDSAKKEATAAVPRRVSSRRGHRGGSEAYAAKRQARETVIAKSRAMDALSGNWSAVVYPEESPTAGALAQVESIFDRYGLITRDIALASGCIGGLRGIYPVLRYLENNGEALRGVFVSGLGPAQFADRHSIEAMRKYTDKHQVSPIVLDIDDPAQLFGTVLPWPIPAGISKPKRREGSLVVIVDGEAVILAAPKLKALTVFTSDIGLIDDAVEALHAHIKKATRSKSGGSKKGKHLIETINEQPALTSDMAPVFLERGFVRDPRGLRLYIDPF